MIYFIKSKKDLKGGKDYEDIKLCRNSVSAKLDVYEFKMKLFDNINPEEFLLIVQNFKMTIEVSGTLIANSNIQYLRDIFCGEEPRQFDTSCVQVVITTTAHLNKVILGLGAYFFQ